MPKTYIELEDLRQVLSDHTCPRNLVLDCVQHLSEQDVANEMSVYNLKHALETKDDVIETEVWTKQDICVALRLYNHEPDDHLVSTIAQTVKELLKDHSDSWDKIQKTIEKALERNRQNVQCKSNRNRTHHQNEP